VGYNTYTEEWNDLVSSTAEMKIPGVMKQSITDHRVLRRLTSNNKIIGGGGTGITFTPSFGENESVRYVSSSAQKIDFKGQAALTKGRVTPAMLTGYLLYNEDDRDANSGDEQIANLVDIKLEQLRDTVDRKMARALYSNGYLDGDPAMKGLMFWAPTNPGSLTIANIPETSMPWWKSQHRPNCGDFAVNGWGGSDRNYFLNMYVRCSDGGRRPDLILMDQGLYQEFHNFLLQKVQIGTQNDFKGFGASDLMISGLNAEIIWDPDCDSGTAIFLHTRDWHFYSSRNLDGKLTPIREIPNQPLLSFQFLAWKHQLVCTRRNMQGRTSGWDVSATV
jgi:hypothetical protein